MCNLMSLDGYVAGEGGDVMVLPLDESFSAYNLTRLREADTLLLGVTTFRGFLSYWPDIEHDTGQPAGEREISSINNRIAKVVVSDSLTPSDTGVWRDTTEIVARAQAHRRVAELENEEGGDILTFGSATLWNDLLVAGLVSELHLMIGAGAIGTRRACVPGAVWWAGTPRLADVDRCPATGGLAERTVDLYGRLSLSV